MSAPIRSRTFKSGNSEAVRLPKGMGFGVGRDVVMERRGDQLIIRPAENPADAQRRLRRLVSDLKAIGRAGEVQSREPIDFPDRPGLE